MLPIEDIARIRPTGRQLRWQSLELYAFIHFGMNTFTDREWGTGTEDPALFAPSALDPDQWARTCRSAGMRGLILSCKHHDGFCLWPSAWTDHSVKASPWKGGAGDVVREVSDACRRAGLAFGVYLSPWDRHERSYGDSEAYNVFYKRQLRELLSYYGPVFSVWLDGAGGEGPNGMRQEYDWEGFYRIVRELQPEAVISICGPDVRWCGNEAGACRASEWSVVPAVLRHAEKTMEKSQKVDDAGFSRRVRSADEDLGSRQAIEGFRDLAWYPAEVNTSIRPGWFYHAAEDGAVRSLDELLFIYESSVGGNASFLLNLPPDRRGLIHETDAERMRELGRALDRMFRVDNAASGTATASEEKDAAHGAVRILDGDPDTFWCPREGTEAASIEVDLGEERRFSRVVVMEHIASGQRIERFGLSIPGEGGWRRIFDGTVVGHKRICSFPAVSARRVRLSIEESRWCPTVSFLGVYGEA
jgi:alpha-L-fucosidase